MASDLVVRIVERYLGDYREVFAESNRLGDLMDYSDVFVRAGWPNAQALTFRLGEIWRWIGADRDPGGATELETSTTTTVWMFLQKVRFAPHRIIRVPTPAR